MSPFRLLLSLIFSLSLPAFIASEYVCENRTVTETTLAAKVDFLFILDKSGSMDDIIDGVKSGFTAFVNALESEGTDYRFAQIKIGSNPTVMLPFTSDRAKFERRLQNFGSAGGQETMFEAMRMAFPPYNQYLSRNCASDDYSWSDCVIAWRSDALKVIIGATDEDSDLPRRSEMRQPGQTDESFCTKYSTDGTPTGTCSGTRYNVGFEDSELYWVSSYQQLRRRTSGVITLKPTYQQELDETANLMIANDVYVNMLMDPDASDNHQRSYTQLSNLGDGLSTAFAQFGNPSLMHQNSDFSGFSPSQTMVNLQNGGLAQSLAYKMLAAGRKNRVFDVRNFANNNVDEIEAFYRQLAQTSSRIEQNCTFIDPVSELVSSADPETASSEVPASSSVESTSSPSSCHDDASCPWSDLPVPTDQSSHLDSTCTEGSSCTWTDMPAPTEASSNVISSSDSSTEAPRTSTEFSDSAYDAASVSSDVAPSYSSSLEVSSTAILAASTSVDNESSSSDVQTADPTLDGSVEVTSSSSDIMSEYASASSLQDVGIGTTYSSSEKSPATETQATESSVTDSLGQSLSDTESTPSTAAASLSVSEVVVASSTQDELPTDSPTPTSEGELPAQSSSEQLPPPQSTYVCDAGNECDWYPLPDPSETASSNQLDAPSSTQVCNGGDDCAWSDLPAPSDPAASGAIVDEQSDVVASTQICDNGDSCEWSELPQASATNVDSVAESQPTGQQTGVEDSDSREVSSTKTEDDNLVEDLVSPDDPAETVEQNTSSSSTTTLVASVGAAAAAVALIGAGFFFRGRVLANGESSMALFSSPDRTIADNPLYDGITTETENPIYTDIEAGKKRN